MLILATVLAQHRLYDQQTLADLFGVRRRTIRNAINEVLPLLNQYGYSGHRALAASTTRIRIHITSTSTILFVLSSPVPSSH